LFCIISIVLGKSQTFKTISNETLKRRTTILTGHMLALSLVLKFSYVFSAETTFTGLIREPLVLCYGHLAGDTIRRRQDIISDHCYPAMFQQMQRTRRIRHFHTSKTHSADFLDTKSQPLRPSVSYFEFTLIFCSPLCSQQPLHCHETELQVLHHIHVYYLKYLP